MHTGLVDIAVHYLRLPHEISQVCVCVLGLGLGV